ncbi:hypothetical protein NQZ68_024402, partial [Dissostichus eleginoides]
RRLFLSEEQRDSAEECTIGFTVLEQGRGFRPRREVTLIHKSGEPTESKRSRSTCLSDGGFMSGWFRLLWLIFTIKNSVAMPAAVFPQLVGNLHSSRIPPSAINFLLPSHLSTPEWEVNMTHRGTKSLLGGKCCEKLKKDISLQHLALRSVSEHIMAPLVPPPLRTDVISEGPALPGDP